MGILWYVVTFCTMFLTFRAPTKMYHNNISMFFHIYHRACKYRGKEIQYHNIFTVLCSVNYMQ